MIAPSYWLRLKIIRVADLNYTSIGMLLYVSPWMTLTPIAAIQMTEPIAFLVHGQKGTPIFTQSKQRPGQLKLPAVPQQVFNKALL